MPINIHGNSYVTVAERIQLAHDDNEKIDIDTQIVSTEPVVVVKALVRTSKGFFIGHSAANPDKPIEKQSPYEVAESSAVGRALGFAGYGLVDSIATADEVLNASQTSDNSQPAQTTHQGVKPSNSGSLPPKQTPTVKDPTSAPSEKQLKMVRDLMEQKGYSVTDMIDQGFSTVEEMTKGTASEAISFLLNAKAKVTPNGTPVEPPIESFDAPVLSEEEVAGIPF